MWVFIKLFYSITSKVWCFLQIFILLPLFKPLSWRWSIAIVASALSWCLFLQNCLCVAIQILHVVHSASWFLFFLTYDLQKYLKPWSKNLHAFVNIPIWRFSPFTSKTDVKMSSVFFLLLDYYLVMSECN